MIFKSDLRFLNILIFSGLIIAGCKFPGSDSSKKSIEAVATGDQSVRSNMTCGPGSLPNEKAGDAVIRSYYALPELLGGIFSPEGSYKTVGDPTAECSAGLDPEKFSGSDAEKRMIQDSRLAGLKSCWKTAVVTDGYPAPKIILGETPQDVHNALLTASFYAFSEWYMDRVAGPALDKMRADNDTTPQDSESKALMAMVDDFRDARKELATAVLADLSAAGKSDVIAKYEQDFGKTFVSLADEVAFQNFVSAEFTDTWYCSVDTRRAIANSDIFLKARKAYGKMASVLGKAWFEEREEQ